MRLRLVSWNVGRLYSRRPVNRLDDRDIPRVARTLYELDADVVLLQELVDARQLAMLLAHAAGYRGAIAERCRYDRHVAALARAELAPEFEQHLLEETGRGLVAARIAVGDEHAWALAVHFDVFSPPRRRNQVEAACAILDARDEAVLAVGGDFNLDPEWAERLHTLDAATFRLLSSRLTDGGRAAGPTLMGFGRVDHLLAGGRRVARIYTRVSPNRRLPLGDHDPLVCDLHLS